MLSDAEGLLVLGGLVAVEGDSREIALARQIVDRGGSVRLLAKRQQTRPLGLLRRVDLGSASSSAAQDHGPHPPPLGVAGQANLEPSFKLALAAVRTGETSLVAEPSLGRLALAEKGASVDLVASRSLPASETDRVDPHLSVERGQPASQ